MLIHLICSSGRNSVGDIALPFLSYLFSDFSDTSNRSFVLAPVLSLLIFSHLLKVGFIFGLGLLSLVQGVL